MAGVIGMASLISFVIAITCGIMCCYLSFGLDESAWDWGVVAIAAFCFGGGLGAAYLIIMIGG